MNANAKLVLVDQANNYTILNFDDTTYDGEISFQVNFTTGREIVFGFLPQSTIMQSISYTIEAYYMNETSSSNNLENPFGELPGYPIEIIGSFSIIVLFVMIKKQKRKIVD